jgi:PAS domain S-box-containing protein
LVSEDILPFVLRTRYWLNGPNFAEPKDGIETVLLKGRPKVASNRNCEYPDRNQFMEMRRDITGQDQTSTELEKALREIKRSEAELRAFVDAVPAHAWGSRSDGYNILCNQQWLDYSGFTQETARGWSYRDTIHPDDIDPYVQKWAEAAATGVSIDAEVRFRRFDGEYRWFLVRAVPVREENGNIIKWFGTNTDIDDRKKAEALLAGENKILEMVATGKPLAVILEELCFLFDSISVHSMASVLLVDSGNFLRRGAAPRFPKDLISLVDGLKIGPTVGSCGTAAHRKEQVIVTDIETDPLWSNFRELARQYRLRAGWSTPIFSSERRLLGVFGIYWDKPQSPTSAHLRLIDQITHLASVAIERQAFQEAIRASERFARGQADTLTRTLDEMARESSFDRIAEYVLRALTSQLGASSSSVFLWNGTSGLMDLGFVLERGQLKSKSDAKLSAVSPSLPVNDVPPWREAFGTGKPVVLKDIRGEGLDFPWRLHVLNQGIVTILVIPTFVAGEPAAAFGIRFEQQRQFRPEELELAQALANQAMLAMQLTRLSEQSRLSAVVAERNRLAREVHDTLAQGFTGVIVQLEAAGEAMAQSLSDKVSGHLERASSLARESLREARRSVKALRPQALEENTLHIALNDLFAKSTSDTPLTAKLTVDGEPRQLPSEWENNLLRIGQEVLTNAVRHSRATEFHCRLSFDTREVRMHLRDNGIGFDPESRHEGFGLQGIRERAETMGGHLAIMSEKGRGASISIILPFGC